MSCGWVRGLLVMMVVGVGSAAWAQEAPGSKDAGPLVKSPMQKAAPIERVEAPSQLQEPVAPAVVYDKAIFQKPMAASDLAFLKGFAGATSNELYRDKEFKRVLKAGVPDVMFHYGRDMSLPSALEAVLSGSPMPVRVTEGRYVTLEGRASLYPGLSGKGFVWVDMQEGVVLGAFYFHPSNGEPTPSVTVFSKMIAEDAITMGELPPAFEDELIEWQQSAGVPMVTTRYFIGDTREKILLEHDEDYCAPIAGAPATDAPPPAGCEQMDADAADLDMNAAYYLEQTHHATNATAWMITEQDQIAFVDIRERSCRTGPDPLGCRVRLTHEHIGVIVHRPAPHPEPHPIRR